MTEEEIERDLEALEAAGARRFDALACDCVRTLLARSEALGGAVGERLVARAASHLEALKNRFEREHERVTLRLAAVQEQCGGQPHAQRWLAEGDVVRAARAVRRARRRPKRPRLLSPETTVEAPLTDAQLPRAHDAAPADDVAAAVDIARLRRRHAIVYEDSVADLVASFALARAVDVVPDDAGPYNALRIASEALDAMRALSPSYLAAQLSRLEELGSLLALPELPPKPEPPRSPARKKRRATKR